MCRVARERLRAVAWCSSACARRAALAAQPCTNEAEEAFWTKCEEDGVELDAADVEEESWCYRCRRVPGLPFRLDSVA